MSVRVAYRVFRRKSALLHHLTMDGRKGTDIFNIVQVERNNAWEEYNRAITDKAQKVSATRNPD